MTKFLVIQRTINGHWFSVVRDGEDVIIDDVRGTLEHAFADLARYCEENRIVEMDIEVRVEAK